MGDHEPMTWNVNFETGVTEIDDQHRILVNALNEVNNQSAGNSSAEFLEKITRDLLSYALYHFETEEELMREYGYEEEEGQDAEAHLQQHRSFSAQVVAVRDGLKAGNLISREELLGFLNSWLVNHILNTDRRLGAFIVAKRQQAA
jgi:hemerythrin-like metal-binding protein